MKGGDGEAAAAAASAATRRLGGPRVAPQAAVRAAVAVANEARLGVEDVATAGGYAAMDSGCDIDEAGHIAGELARNWILAAGGSDEEVMLRDHHDVCECCLLQTYSSIACSTGKFCGLECTPCRR